MPLHKFAVDAHAKRVENDYVYGTHTRLIIPENIHIITHAHTLTHARTWKPRGGGGGGAEWHVYDLRRSLQIA